MPVYWAVGPCVSDTQEIPDSYRFAKLAWMYRSASGQQQITFYSPEQIQALAAPDPGIEEHLLLLFGLPDADRNPDQLQTLLDRMFDHPAMTHSDYIYHVFYYSFQIISRLSFHSADAQSLYEQCAGLLEHKYEFTGEKLKQWFRAFLQKVSAVQDRRTSKTIHTIIQEMIQDIDRHYNEDLSLAGYAERFQISQAYLSTSFKKITGAGFVDYLTQKRLRQAEVLLADTSLSIREIAAMTGYVNTKYFSQSFRKYTGSTPSDYRLRKTGTQTDHKEE